MNARTQRTLGLACLVLSAVIGILNLKRTMNLGMNSTGVILLIVGAVLMRKSRQKTAG